MNYLALIWIGIIAFAVIMYVILDGFDLGLGILSAFVKEDRHRDLMVSTILPVWDGNQTWLVFGGAALYGAFPLAFGIVLPAIYIPIILMVIALLFRGVAFEFRLKAKKSKRFWEISFFGGSLLAALIQGMVLGTFIRGFQMTGPNEIALYQWFNLFGVFCGIALIFGYALLGSNRLIAKTTGALQAQCFRISAKLQYAIAFFAIAVSIWSPYLDPRLTQRWFNPEYMPYLAILPLLTAVFFILHWYSINKKFEHAPFWLSVGIFLMCYLGFIISSYPYLVPRHITYYDAAANPSTLIFTLVGACIILPMLLGYTFYSYRVFRGKVTDHIQY